MRAGESTGCVGGRDMLGPTCLPDVHGDWWGVLITCCGRTSGMEGGVGLPQPFSQRSHINTAVPACCGEAKGCTTMTKTRRDERMGDLLTWLVGLQL